SAIFTGSPVPPFCRAASRLRSASSSAFAGVGAAPRLHPDESNSAISMQALRMDPSSQLDQITFRSFEEPQRIGHTLHAAQFVEEARPQHYARQASKYAQMSPRITATDKEEEIGQSAVGSPKRNAARGASEGDDRFPLCLCGERPMRMRDGNAGFERRGAEA